MEKYTKGIIFILMGIFLYSYLHCCLKPRSKINKDAIIENIKLLFENEI